MRIFFILLSLQTISLVSLQNGRRWSSPNSSFACPSRGQQRLVIISNSLEEDFTYSACVGMYPFLLSCSWADRIYIVQTGSQGPIPVSEGQDLEKGKCMGFLAFFPSIRSSQTLTPTAKPTESQRWERKGKHLFKRPCKHACVEKPQGDKLIEQKTLPRERLHKSDSTNTKYTVKTCWIWLHQNYRFLFNKEYHEHS